jgi:hypothetical protein
MCLRAACFIGSRVVYLGYSALLSCLVFVLTGMLLYYETDEVFTDMTQGLLASLQADFLCLGYIGRLRLTRRLLRPSSKLRTIVTLTHFENDMLILY